MSAQKTRRSVLQMADKALQNLWAQIRQAAPALAILAGVATSSFTVGATRGHSQLSVRAAIAAQAKKIERLETLNARKDSALSRLSSSVNGLALEVCLLRYELRKNQSTEECSREPKR